jgi:hypothetical protein
MAITHNGGTRTWPRRPHFAPNQQLTAQQLNAIIEDELRRQRMLTRALHGHGVVFGYGFEPYAKREAYGDEKGELERKDHCIHVSCGLIIDLHGRDLYWPGGWLCLGDIVSQQPGCEGWYIVNAHYAERPDPLGGCGSCPSDAVQWLEQKVVFTLSPWYPQPNWNCAELPSDQCVTLRDYICGRSGSENGPVPPADDLKWACSDPGPLSCETPCGGWKYDRGAGIPIARVWVKNLAPKDAECAVYGFDPDQTKVCEFRPYVYRTPLLFDLARDCHIDLARVASLSCQDWLIEGGNPVSWEKFILCFGPEAPGLDIRFTKPIDVRTLNERSIFLTALIQGYEADYWTAHRVPARIEPLEEHGGFADGARLVFDDEWVVSEIKQKRSTLCHGALIELTIRCQMLRDHCGRMPDARPIAAQQQLPADKQPDPFFLDSKWLGQARPGGDFVFAFRVEPRPGHERYDRDQYNRPGYQDQSGTPGSYPPVSKPVE